MRKSVILLFSLLSLFRLANAQEIEVKAGTSLEDTGADLYAQMEKEAGRARLAYFRDSSFQNKEALISSLGKAAIFAASAKKYDRQLLHLEEGLALDPDDCILRMSYPYALALNNRITEAEWEIRQHLHLNCADKKYSLKIAYGEPLQGPYTMHQNYAEVVKTWQAYQVASPEKLQLLSRLHPDSVKYAHQAISTDTVLNTYHHLYQLIPKGKKITAHHSPVHVVAHFLTCIFDHSPDYAQAIEQSMISTTELDYWTKAIQLQVFSSAHALPGAPGYCRVQITWHYFTDDIQGIQSATDYFSLKWNGRQWVIIDVPG